MLCDDGGSCHPTVEQIREDLGLLSSSMVFEGLSVLEEMGFIVRERQAFPDSRSHRNLYRRTACEFTIVRLIERGKIDGFLRPAARSEAPASDESKTLAVEGLRAILGPQYDRYQRAASDAKTEVVLDILGESLRNRERGIYQ